MLRIEKMGGWVFFGCKRGESSLGFFGAKMLPRRSHENGKENGKDNAPQMLLFCQMLVCRFRFVLFLSPDVLFPILDVGRSVSSVERHDKSMHIAFHLDWLQQFHTGFHVAGWWASSRARAPFSRHVRKKRSSICIPYELPHSSVKDYGSVFL